MQIVRYEKRFEETWNAVVRQSSGGTFLLLRPYMDYHSQRFQDCSLLFFEKDQCIGLLPANVSDGIVTSHAGLTYGGLLTARSRFAPVREMLDGAMLWLRDAVGAHTFIYKPTPFIYRSYPSEEDLFWLFQRGAKLCGRCLSSVIDVEKASPFSTLRRRKLSKAEKAGLRVSEAQTESEWTTFWGILTDVLSSRHSRKPVHTLSEMLLLHSRFPEEICLFVVRSAEAIIGGSVIYVSREVVHAQYIAAGAEGRELGALDLLFHELLASPICQQRRYFDFGISTDHEGLLLNEGLLFQKEGYGGRGVCYDTYQLHLQP